jgi:SPP1 family predicted phage head-tail adaptor
MRVARTKDAGGFTVTAATPSGPYWASVEPLTEKSRLDFQNVSVSATHRVVIDGAVEADAGDKVGLDGREFLIKTVRREGERRRDKILLTEEIIPGQRRVS